MIEFVEGLLVEAHPTHAIIMHGGLGLRLHIPLSTYEELGTPGHTVRLLTHLFFRENDFELYGFSTEQERKLFRLLIGVTGIGPKSAASILSAVQPAVFHRAVLSGDTERLIAIPGIGRKTAQRLLVELKEKVEAQVPREELLAAPEGDGRYLEAVDALVALGYPKPQAEKAVKDSLDHQPDTNLEDLIREALSRFR
jgi:Holliday junction DNA helicase RuvA